MARISFNVLSRPVGRWVDRLQLDQWVFLVKQNQFATVEWRFLEDQSHSNRLRAALHPNPDQSVGRIAFKLYKDIGDNTFYQEQQTWWMRANGTGFDRSQLILPCEGNLDPLSDDEFIRALNDLVVPDDPPPLPPIVLPNIIFGPRDSVQPLLISERDAEIMRTWSTPKLVDLI